MSKLSRQTLFWAPRALSIVFIAFLSMFALDVFGRGYGFWGTLAALGMHLIPSLVLIAVLVLAWGWEWIGAALYLAAGGFYLFLVTASTRPAAIKLNWILIMAGPAFVIAALFLINWWKHGELRARP